MKNYQAVPPSFKSYLGFKYSFSPSEMYEKCLQVENPRA